jgi:hypothetical protein
MTPQVERPVRGTVRLSLRVTPLGVELLRVEHLDMICPPAVGEPPRLRTHSGHWVSLEDAKGTALFSRVIDSRAFGAAEIFSPDGTIQHVVGSVPESIVEVLLPDVPTAVQASLFGQSMDIEGRGQRSPRHNERLATFDLYGGEQGGKRS